MPNPVKQLDYNGLLYFWQQLKTKLASKVDKIDGMGLSTNDYSTAEKNKLSAIEANAEVNIIEGIRVNNIELVPDANRKVDITDTNTTYTITQDQVDGHTFYFTDSNNQTTTITIPDVGEVNIVGGVSVNGTLIQPDGNKIVDITVPTVVSALTNDADYQTGAEVTQAINDALADITGIEFQIVQSLPASGEKGVIYLVPHSGSAPDVYDEYVWIVVSNVGSWEKIGTTNIDLSNYVQFTDLTPITNQEIDTICSN